MTDELKAERPPPSLLNQVEGEQCECAVGRKAPESASDDRLFGGPFGKELCTEADRKATEQVHGQSPHVREEITGHSLQRCRQDYARGGADSAGDEGPKEWSQ